MVVENLSMMRTERAIAPEFQLEPPPASLQPIFADIFVAKKRQPQPSAFLLQEKKQIVDSLDKLHGIADKKILQVPEGSKV